MLQGMFAGFFAGGVSGQKSKSRGLYVPLGGVFVANGQLVLVALGGMNHDDTTARRLDLTAGAIGSDRSLRCLQRHKHFRYNSVESFDGPFDGNRAWQKIFGNSCLLPRDVVPSWFNLAQVGLGGGRLVRAPTDSFGADGFRGGRKKISRQGAKAPRTERESFPRSHALRGDARCRRSASAPRPRQRLAIALSRRARERREVSYWLQTDASKRFRFRSGQVMLSGSEWLLAIIANIA